MGSWDAQSLYGMGSAAPTQAPDQAHATQQLNPVTQEWAHGAAALVDPRNPLFWFGVVAAVAVGAAGVAGSVRLGPAKVSAAIGKS